MDKELERWLRGRNLSKNTLKVLVKEELLTTEVISILREDDIRQLSTKHSLSVGETVHLREARDAVLRGEFPSASSGGVGAPGAEGDGAGAKDGSLKGDRASAPAVSTNHSVLHVLMHSCLNQCICLQFSIVRSKPSAMHSCLN